MPSWGNPNYEWPKGLFTESEATTIKMRLRWQPEPDGSVRYIWEIYGNAIFPEIVAVAQYLPKSVFQDLTKNNLGWAMYGHHLATKTLQQFIASGRYLTEQQETIIRETWVAVLKAAVDGHIPHKNGEKEYLTMIKPKTIKLEMPEWASSILNTDIST